MLLPEPEYFFLGGPYKELSEIVSVIKQNPLHPESIRALLLHQLSCHEKDIKHYDRSIVFNNRPDQITYRIKADMVKKLLALVEESWFDENGECNVTTDTGPTNQKSYICKECGTSFYSSSSRAKYCGGKCRKAAHDQRKREAQTSGE